VVCLASIRLRQGTWEDTVWTDQIIELPDGTTLTEFVFDPAQWRIVQGLRRRTSSEWRIRAVGRRYLPRARWRRRITDEISLEGIIKAKESDILRSLTTLRYKTSTHEKRKGLYYRIFDASDFGVSDREIWAIERPTETRVDIRTGFASNTGEALATFRMEFRKVGEI